MKIYRKIPIIGRRKTISLLRVSGVFILILLLSCTKERQEEGIQGFSGKKGVFICNEGPFQNGSGTLSFLDGETGELVNSIYEEINNKPLGNIVQSMEVTGDKGYIVVNNANKIVVVDLLTLKHIATIDNVILPRFFCQVDERRAYVTCWDNTVAVINLLTGNVDKHITVDEGPERILTSGDRAFVLNQGGYGTDSTISVININTDELIETLQVYPKPSGAAIDAEGKMWVICSGRGYNGWPGDNDSEGHLLRIDPLSLAILDDYCFPEAVSHPEKLVINKSGDKLFYLYKNSVFSMGIDEAALPAEPLVRHNGYLYALGLDLSTDYLYLSDPVDYVQNGWVFRYRSSDGMPVDSFPTGIIPGFFCFTHPEQNLNKNVQYLKPKSLWKQM